MKTDITDCKNNRAPQPPLSYKLVPNAAQFKNLVLGRRKAIEVRLLLIYFALHSTEILNTSGAVLAPFEMHIRKQFTIGRLSKKLRFHYLPQMSTSGS